MVMPLELMKDIEGLRVEDGETNEVDYEEIDETEETVVLGFVKNPRNKWFLNRQLFPSKAGGVPAWLDPVNLPTGISCTCDICGVPLQFLLQVYAPLFHKESTFHRMLFVFVCTSMNCLIQHQSKQQNCYQRKTSRSVKVFRCQLHRENPYYSFDPPKQDGTDKPRTVGAMLCDWCGSWKGDWKCSRCKIAHYCSKIHQTAHWTSGHKLECCQSISSFSDESVSTKSKVVQIERNKAAASKFLWPEKEIIQEDENESESYKKSSKNKIDINSYVPNEGLDDVSTDAYMDASEPDDEEKSWATFQLRIGKAPEQVLRYCRSPAANPLWPMASERPSESDIPKCHHCGGELSFEFQILPQLLYFFGGQDDVNSIDWETIAVYTCQASCDGGPSYKDEFVWVQHSSPFSKNRSSFKTLSECMRVLRE